MRKNYEKPDLEIVVFNTDETLANVPTDSGVDNNIDVGEIIDNVFNDKNGL